ncbi:helix-turn-helix domain-containing protein [Mesorhizobium sp. M0058]|uniref:helix-turn-helix domain-containing protein n=1 Tax=Mesorhizobium sp. M0058 TaxID=2956865 RepID=UPI003335007A
MNNGIRLFRERANLTKAELSRRIGTTRQQLGRLEDSQRKLTLEWAQKIAPHVNATAQDLMFPEMSRIDTKRFHNVFEIVSGKEAPADSPGLALESDFLARLLPGARRHNLRFMMVEPSQSNAMVNKGDALVIDIDDNKPSTPGLYALEIAGVIQWRYLSPTTTGAVQVRSDDPSIANETVQPKDLTVIGRARLRISTL